MDSKIYNFIRIEIYENEKHPLAIQKLLILKGLSEEEATNAVMKVRELERNKLIANSKKNILFGILLIIAGIFGIISVNFLKIRSKGFLIGSVVTIGTGIGLYSKGKKYSKKTKTN